MKTKEGIPVVEQKTIDSCAKEILSQSPNANKEQWEKLCREQPALGEYTKEMAHLIFNNNPNDLYMFASQFYGLIKRQAEIDKLEDQ